MKCKDLVVCYGIFKDTVSDRVGDGSWMSRKRDGWTEETLLGQESRQKAKRGGGGYRGGDGGTGEGLPVSPSPGVWLYFP